MPPPLPTISILSRPRGAALLDHRARSTASIHLPPTTMIMTVSSVLPVMDLVGVLDPIPLAAWEPAIRTAQRLGVDLSITRHAHPVPHFHFDVTADEEALPSAIPVLAQLLANVFRDYTRSVDLPEGR